MREGARAELERIRAAYRERDALPGASDPAAAEPALVFHYAEREAQLLDWLGRQGLSIDGAAVLDVGCGSGQVLGRFLELGAARAVGVDLVPDRVAAGRLARPRLALAVADASCLPFADGRFDLVTQFTCFSSVLDPAMRRDMADEMWRVTRPGGAVVFYDLRPLPFPITLGRRLLRALAQVKRRLLGRAPLPPSGRPETPVRPLGADEIGRLFPAARLRSASLDLSLAYLARLSVPLTRVLAAMPWLRSHYLAVARKPFDPAPGDRAGGGQGR